MGLLKSAKSIVIGSRGFGLSPIIARGPWRNRHLLILCYHGIAMGEEHASHPEMFLPADTFEARLSRLKAFGANVLDLGEAVRRLKEGTLPPRSVSITFDDGWADFYVKAYPALRKFGFPATVYLTTYYCFYNRPIFLFALRHMMWKQRERVIEGHHFTFLPPVLDLRTEQSRTKLSEQINDYARTQDLSGKQRDELADQFASAIGFDYSEITRDRLFHVLNPEEVAAIASGGIDVQLHTHRHRTPLNRDSFVKEVRENRQYVSELTGRNHLVHFCYPSGAIRPDFLPWLKEAGVETATTCDHGFASQGDDPLLLPRLLDQFRIAESEFDAWLSGLMAFLPKRQYPRLDVAPE